jgi:succinate dehydrogenase / fumarate reductase membrane anchor subunit
MHPLTGLRAWIVQRVTAVYMVLFLVYAAVVLVPEPPAGYAAWRALFAEPLFAVTFGLFAGALLYHSWVGVRDVILDYVANLPLRGALLVVLAGVLAGQGLWVVLILAGVAG